MNKFTVTYRWREAKDQHGVISAEVFGKHAQKHYGPIRGENCSGASKVQAEIWAESAQSCVSFRDITDLRPSTAWRSIFGYGANPPGFDHPSVWCKSRNQYAVTTEPYAFGDDEHSSLTAIRGWCASQGWQCHVFEPGIGMWYASGGTRLVLMSPAKRGVDIQPMIPIIHEKMPRISIPTPDQEAIQ